MTDETAHATTHEATTDDAIDETHATRQRSVTPQAVGSIGVLLAGIGVLALGGSTLLDHGHRDGRHARRAVAGAPEALRGEPGRGGMPGGGGPQGAPPQGGAPQAGAPQGGPPPGPAPQGAQGSVLPRVAGGAGGRSVPAAPSRPN